MHHISYHVVGLKRQNRLKVGTDKPKLQESRAIAWRTARCRCKFRYVSNFTTASYVRSPCHSTALMLAFVF